MLQVRFQLIRFAGITVFFGFSQAEVNTTGCQIMVERKTKGKAIGNEQPLKNENPNYRLYLQQLR